MKGLVVAREELTPSARIAGIVLDTTGAEAGRATTPVVLGDAIESRGQDWSFTFCEQEHLWESF